MSPGPVLALLALGWAGTAAASAAPAELRRAAREHFEAGDFEGAYDRINKALALTPYDPETLSLRLRIEVLGGSRVAPWVALADVERRAREPGLSSAALAELLAESGRLRLRVGDYSGAESDCRRALLLAPGHGEASFRLAEALRDSPESAVTFAEQAALAAATPRLRTMAHRLAGELRLDLGDLEGARRSLEESLEIDGENFRALRAMVRVLAVKPKQARVFAIRAGSAAERAPAWARAASLRYAAHIWLELKAYDEAEELLGRALAVDPDDLDSLETLALIKYERPDRRLRTVPGPPEGARAVEPPVLESAEAAVRFAGETAEMPSWLHADAYRLLARSWLALGDRRKAARYARHAEEAEIGSVRTARILTEISPGGEDSPRDLAEALRAVAQARAEL